MATKTKQKPKSNPGTSKHSIMKPGKWIPAHAVRIYKGKLEILK